MYCTTVSLTPPLPNTRVTPKHGNRVLLCKTLKSGAYTTARTNTHKLNWKSRATYRLKLTYSHILYYSLSTKSQTQRYKVGTYKVHGGAFQPAAHLGWVELVLAPCYWKRCHCSGIQRQKWRKSKRKYKNPLASQCTQPVSATKNAEKKRVKVKTAVEVLILKAQTQESPSLAAEKYICQVCIGIPLLLMSCTWISITAQQFGWWFKERRGGGKEENGMEVEKQ